MSAKFTAFQLMNLGRVENYWPNLRTLSICNVYISPWTYLGGKATPATGQTSTKLEIQERPSTVASNTNRRFNFDQIKIC